MNKLTCALTLSGATLLFGQASAALLYSFETTDLDGWAFMNGSNATLSQSTLGATDGTHSMKIVWDGVFFWFATYNLLGSGNQAAELDKVKFFDMDVTIPTGGVPGTNWMNALLAFNDGVHGWRQLANSFDIPFTAGTYTIKVDYSTLAPPDGSKGWAQMAIALNANSIAGSNKTVYIDNLRTVPEPASILAVLIGWGALSLRRRRR